ncbi:hypothetical protein [Bdellovibrio sp. HCB209]|uniref:hypothetical protein n=1 Tax=Bdellovibrio sp. HCB209 TaxID=3394354 RepID=UPI0039B6896E
MRFLLIVLASLSFVACSTNRNKAEKVDTKLENAAPVGSGNIGIKDGDMVYQRKVQMNEQLRTLENEVYDLEARVFGGPRYLDNRGMYGVLRDCRIQMGETENNGDGKMRWTEARTYVTSEEDFSKIGVENKKDIVGVTEEGLRDRIDRFKGYKDTLIKRQDEYETKVKMCELELKQQKAKNKVEGN